MARRRKKEKIYKPGMSLEELARQAKARYAEAESKAKTNWDAMIPTMHANYDALPFGPTRKSNYKLKVTAGKLRFDPDEWERRYVQKMRL